MSDTQRETQLGGQALLDDVLHEALDEPREERREERRLPEPGAPAAPPRDYYEAAISERRKKLKELQDKVMNHESNRAYVKTGQNGSEYIDIVAMNADQARISALTMEIQQLREESDKRRQNASQRRELATAKARAYGRAEVAKLPEDMRKPVATKFTEMFASLTEAGGWDKAHYANPANLDNDIAALWKMALGEVAGQRFAAPGGQPVASGLDGEEAKPEEKGEELDAFTNNLMYAYERRRKSGMTFAEAKKAQQGGQS